MSEQVARTLGKHGQFELDCRGPIFVKGKGQLTTYLVVTPYDCPYEHEDDYDLEEAPPELAPDDDVEELCSESGFSCRLNSDV